MKTFHFPLGLRMARTAMMRGRSGPLVEERPLAGQKKIGELTDADVAALLTTEIPKLVMRN